MRSSCSVGADDSLWGAGQVITLLQDVLTDQPGGALAWSAEGNTSLSGFSWDGRGLEQMSYGRDRRRQEEAGDEAHSKGR